MNTQISTKLAALTAALVMNAMMLGSAAYLFNGQLHPALSSYAGNGVTALMQVRV